MDKVKILQHDILTKDILETVINHLSSIIEHVAVRVINSKFKPHYRKPGNDSIQIGMRYQNLTVDFDSVIHVNFTVSFDDLIS